MNRIILLLCKISQWILNIKDKGSAYPGQLALTLNKNILTYFEMPKTTIFITGTTGKTSIAGMLTQMISQSGKKVTSNSKGSNLINGVTSAIIKSSKLSGKSKVDALVIEIDERYVKEVCKYITPTYFIINNLSRDQLARNGHFELVFEEIKKSLSSKTHLVLNADDPLVVQFSLHTKNKITYYGIAKHKLAKLKKDRTHLDVNYCPICANKLDFTLYHYGNLGHYDCPSCSFTRPNPHYEAMIKNEKIFEIEGHTIPIMNEAIYNTYNILACYTVGKLMKLEEQNIVNTLNNLSLQVKRLATFHHKDIQGTILLSKNETPLSYNQSLEYITKQKEKKTVAIGFTRISGRYDLKDLSWLYDIDFELLNHKTVDKIILIGPFAYDIAVRLKQAGIQPNKFLYCLDSNQTLEFLEQKVKGSLYCVFYFDMDKLLRKQLKERGIAVW